MEITLTIWSLILLIGTIIIFLIVSSSATFLNFFIVHFHFHPLKAILLLTIGCFFLALIGMKDVKNRATLIISYITITITNVSFHGNYLFYIDYWALVQLIGSS
ncbi:hypothetical protein [Lysinibacillus sp. JNUCC-52]|uniref:hypothetical protein n=1 Tax=Lysinibacillus sp. JNUCC-52 TaxID=2792480 RepID=UPI001935A292|nr:hypothetical protein JNUCC52_03490 [Lysinibacillus sp. JNUCC-52]